MIQCETRLASVLWRFQIKSTLHNSLFTMEFFSNLKKLFKHILGIWRKDPNGLSRKPSLPYQLAHLPPPLAQLPTVRREQQPPGIWGGVNLFFSQWDLFLEVVMVREITAAEKAPSSSRRTNCSRLYKTFRDPRVLLFGEPL